MNRVILSMTIQRSDGAVATLERSFDVDGTPVGVECVTDDQPWTKGDVDTMKAAFGRAAEAVEFT